MVFGFFDAGLSEYKVNLSVDFILFFFCVKILYCFCWIDFVIETDFFFCYGIFFENLEGLGNE